MWSRSFMVLLVGLLVKANALFLSGGGKPGGLLFLPVCPCLALQLHCCITHLSFSASLNCFEFVLWLTRQTVLQVKTSVYSFTWFVLLWCYKAFISSCLKEGQTKHRIPNSSVPDYSQRSHLIVPPNPAASLVLSFLWSLIKNKTGDSAQAVMSACSSHS